MSQKQGQSNIRSFNKRNRQVTGTSKTSLTPNYNALIKNVMNKTNDLRTSNSRGGMRKMANAQVVRALPKIYSPLYEISNLMLPRDQKTLNAWNRHFYETMPIVRNSINLHATYPVSKFNLSCDDPYIKQFFEDMFEHINIRAVLLALALEYWKLGEVFPYAELDENNGIWDYVFMHNPDFIRVKTNVLSRDPIITLVPDDALRRLVNATNPADMMLRQQLPDQVLYHLQKGEDIPLPNFNVSHLKMLSADYDVRGTSIITSIYKDLMLYDKIREAKFAQADDMINPITLVKLGDPNGTWKPNDQDIQDFQNIIEEAQYDTNFKLVTHGAVTIERVGVAGAVLDITSDMELIIKNILTGLFTPEAVTHGEGPTYATAGVGLEVLRARYIRFRDHIEQWMVKKIMEPICKIHDFYKWKDGERRLIVPKVRWNKINLRDIDTYLGHLTGMMAQEIGTGKISDETVFEFLDLDYNEEQRKTKKEMVDRIIRQKEIEELQGMTLEELRTLDPDKPIISKITDQQGVEQIPGEQAEELGDIDFAPSPGGGEGLPFEEGGEFAEDISPAEVEGPGGGITPETPPAGGEE